MKQNCGSCSSHESRSMTVPSRASMWIGKFLEGFHAYLRIGIGPSISLDWRRACTAELQTAPRAATAQPGENILQADNTICINRLCRHVCVFCMAFIIWPWPSHACRNSASCFQTPRKLVILRQNGAWHHYVDLKQPPLCVLRFLKMLSLSG